MSISVYTVYLGRKALGERKRRALRKDCYGDHAGGPCGQSSSSKPRELGAGSEIIGSCCANKDLGVYFDKNGELLQSPSKGPTSPDLHNHRDWSDCNIKNILTGCGSKILSNSIPKMF